MGLFLPPFNADMLPTQGNIRTWMENVYSKLSPIEQPRWYKSQTDMLFYAGCQEYLNNQFTFVGPVTSQNYYMNLVQQPINMVTGYQRQHRKSINYQAGAGGDPQTTDQYTRLMMHEFEANGINETYSKSCEKSAIAGLNLLQPYLDFTKEDPGQGSLRVKLWEFNSFLTDPYAREADFSDSNLTWCQEYITKESAISKFPEYEEQIRAMGPVDRGLGRFYFLPENQNLMRTDLAVLSYIWYKWKRKRKKLYSPKQEIYYDVRQNDQNILMLIKTIPDLKPVDVIVESWRCAVVLNDQLMWDGYNPLDIDCYPMVPMFWNYDPEMTYYELRNRSLIRVMTDPQFLFNWKLAVNNDIASATINSGYKRKVGAVANEDNLKKVNAGWDILINPEFEMGDVEKIIPTAVPQSDLELGNMFADLIFKTSGVNLENWSGQNDKQISSLTMLMKQAANLMVFQKYFDQWDFAFETLGDICLKIVLNNWNPTKIGLLIGEEPSPYFYSQLFTKYKVVVEEGLLTPTQRNLQAQQMLDINQTFGREVIPASMIIKDMNIQGKAEIMQYLQQQEQQMQAQQQEETTIKHAFEEVKLKELLSRAAANIAMAKERNARSDSNVGLLEERLSEISKNQSLSTKSKMEALEKLVETAAKYGELETKLKMNQVNASNNQEVMREDYERIQAKQNNEEEDEFLKKIMGANPMNPNPTQMQPQTQNMEEAI